MLVGLLFTMVMYGFAQKGTAGVVIPQSSATIPSDVVGTPLMQLLKTRPEVAALLKNYLAQRMRMEGYEVEAKSITNRELYDRVEKDPAFARDASRWLTNLASETAQILQAPVAAAEGESAKSLSTPGTSAPAVSQPSTAIGSKSAESVPNTTTDNSVARGGISEEQRVGPGAAQVEPSAGESGLDTSTGAPDENQSNNSLRSLPKNLLTDQKAFWTLPFHMNVTTLGFIVPATFGTALLVGSDTAIESHLPTAPNTVKMAVNASIAGAAALIGTGGALYLFGQVDHDEHKREAGILTGEAAIDAYAASTALQYITQRARPFTGNGKGQFFDGGNSFPSNTAAVSWAAASVIAHEYPGTLTKLLAYGAAAGVSAGRVIGEKHWTSDAVVGSALGWYMGRQIYRARSAGPDIDAAKWGTFTKGNAEKTLNPAYMGSTYVPLDSWVYPAFDRLTSLGYIPTAMMALKPWPRLQCARWVLEARERLESAPAVNLSVNSILGELQLEFGDELSELKGDVSNVGVQLESVYARYTQIGGRPLRDAWHFGQTLYDDFGRPYGEGANAIVGASGRAEAGPLAFYARAEYQHGAPITEYTPAQAVAIGNADVLPPDSVPTFRQVDQFRVIEAYVALNVHDWEFSFGKQNLSWGQAYGGSLILSDNAEGMTMLRVGRVTPYQLPGFLSWMGKWKNTAYVGAVGGYRYYRGPYPDFQLNGNAFQILNPQPYSWGDKLSLKVSPNIEIGATVQVLWAGPTRPATEMTWLHTWSLNGNFQTLDPGKRYTGFNFSYRLPHLRDWAIVYADGLANDESSPLGFPRKSAWNPGLYLPQLPGLPHLDLRFEGVYTNIPNYPGVGPIYSNNHYADGYRNDLQLMGSWVGRQGNGLAAWSTYWFSGQNKIQLAYRRQWVDPIFLEGGGLNDFSVNVSWLLKHQFQVSSMVQYERWNFPLLSATAQSDVAAQFQVTYWPLHTAISSHP